MAKTIEPKVMAVDWAKDRCVMLDQTRIPSETVTLECDRYPQVVVAIKTLAVRGAPAIGVAGAYGVVLAHREATQKPAEKRAAFFENALEELATARPTAVNLRWAVEKMRALATSFDLETNSKLLDEAKRIHREDIEANQKMAQLGSALLSPGKGVLTYCNTGDLATGGVGTAFGVLHQGFVDGKVAHVYACETRPVLQGARLTAWELLQNKIPFSLICDNMAAMVMSQGKVSAVILGSDRIAANGDVCNKIGSYSLAVLAKHHKIPFFAVAPTSTFDLSLKTGAEIPIEERSPEEIYQVLGKNRFPKPPGVYNPAFDVTPHELVTAIVCEKGVIERPNTERVRAVLK